MRRFLLLLVGFSQLLASGARADEAASRIPDVWVEEALDAAGPNRGELARALTHYWAEGDARKAEAVRFLVANMPGHGYVIAEFRDAKGQTLSFDPLAFETYAEARAAREDIERRRGPLRVERSRVVADVETIRADYLIRHVDAAFAAWGAAPAEARVDFDTFLHYVLPYRGSQEPVDAWIGPLAERYRPLWGELEGDLAAIRKDVSKDVHRRVRFNERYYLHPTDQSFSEMLASGQGRCEDITNMMTYASRSLALATAADYTPAWAHRDNNHAWNVALDRNGRGFERGNAHAAKVYRKTFALQRDALAYQLGPDEEAPNRWMASKTYVDVTDQYRETTDVTIRASPWDTFEKRFAYVCVFNGGRWVPIHWGRFARGTEVTFDRMGRDIAYLAAVWHAGELQPIAPPFLVHANGTVRFLPGTAGATQAILNAVRPKQKSVDTQVETPISYLEAGASYVLQRWTRAGWQEVHAFTATDEALRLSELPADGLYWLVEKESRRLERIFTLEEGRQRWW